MCIYFFLFMYSHILIESISHPSLLEQRADGGPGHRKPPPCARPGAAGGQPGPRCCPGPRSRMGWSILPRCWQKASRLHGQGRRQIPSKPSLPEWARGASLGDSCRLPSLQNGRISSFSRACDLNPFLGQCTDGGDVSPPPPPPPPSVPKEET